MNKKPQIPSGLSMDSTVRATTHSAESITNTLEKDYSFLVRQLDPNLKASELSELMELLDEMKEGSDMSYANEMVEELQKKFGIKPILTIPRKYLKTITKEKRVTAREGYIPGVYVIAARLGAKPYKDNQDRVAFYIKPHIRVVAVASGPNKAFWGTVAVDGRDSLIYDPNDLDKSDIVPIAA